MADSNVRGMPVIPFGARDDILGSGLEKTGLFVGKNKKYEILATPQVVARLRDAPEDKVEEMVAAIQATQDPASPSLVQLTLADASHSGVLSMVKGRTVSMATWPAWRQEAAKNLLRLKGVAV